MDVATLKIYTDGSGQDGTAGAAAILFKGGEAMKILHYQLGSLEHHTTYEAELIGILLGVWIAQQSADAGSVSIKADSQAAIQAIRAHKQGPGSYLLDEIRELSTELCVQSSSDLHLNVSWVSGHDGVAGNERMDIEAKAAAVGSSSAELELPPLLRSSPLPHSVTAAKQHFHASLVKKWKDYWQKSPRFPYSAKIDSRLPDASFLRLTKEISKSQASTVFQLRSKHIALCKHLHRIGKSDSPTCLSCGRDDETVHHFLFDCPAHQHARSDLGHVLGRHSKSLRYLLGNKAALKPLLHFLNETGRFRGNQDLPCQLISNADTHVPAHQRTHT